MNETAAFDDRLKDIYELTRLYDMYGELLGEHNRQIFEDYVLNNYSLGEIGEERGISRQGVRDTVKRCSAKLKEYEEKLGFLRKSDDALKLINELLEHEASREVSEMLGKVKNVLED